MDVTMASLRTSLINEAKQLAAAADLAGNDHGHHVPDATIARIHHCLRCVDEPAKILEWAWRWQRTRHDESGWRVDGLAALYLLAALIDLRSAAAGHTDDRPAQSDDADVLGDERMRVLGQMPKTARIGSIAK